MRKFKLFTDLVTSKIKRINSVIKRFFKHSIVPRLIGTIAIVAKFSHKLALKIHLHAARRPHHHLRGRWKWYDRWHKWDYHKHVHVIIASAYILAVFLLVLSVHRTTFAADLSTTWDFSDISDFSFNDDFIETDSASAKLKAQNYKNDAQTAALFHLDESSGTTANDSSSNNNDASAVGTPSFGTGALNNGLSLDGNKEYLDVPDSNSLTLAGQHTLEGWTKFNDPFDVNASQDQGIIDKGSYQLYYDGTSGKVNYEIADGGATNWTRQAGIDTKGSWDADGKVIVRSTVAKDDDVYVGLGLGVGDAEVWRWNGTSWAQIGGDGMNSSWSDQIFEDVQSLAISGNTLYAGLGVTAGDGEVWQCNISTGCTNWTRIGGDGVNSSWGINAYESVHSMTVMGGQLYAGLGASANDAEVWRWNGTSWAQIGGDSINSGWTTNYELVHSLTNDGTNIYAGLGNTAGDGEVWRYNGTSWSRIGGDGVNSSWAVADNIESVFSLDYFGGNLYAGTGTTAGDGDVWRYNGTSWTKIGGDGINSGWPASMYELVGALTNDGTNLYAGLANSDGDGEVFRWNGSSWLKIGGDGVGSSWTTAQGDGIYALDYENNTLYSGTHDTAGHAQLWGRESGSWTRLGGGYTNQSWAGAGLQSAESSATLDEKLYVGTGITTAGNALVWEFDGDRWKIIGGQGVNGSWAPETFENVFTLQSFEGDLYAGIGLSANDGEVWKYDGNNWTKVGGDGVNGGWGANFESVYSLTVYNGDLYAGTGASATDAEVWRWNGSSWTRVGGDGVNSSWAVAGNIEAVYSLTVYDGNLYAGLGFSANDADIWRYNGTSWTQVGGDGIASSWGAGYEEIFAMRIYDGKLVAGLGSTTGDAEIWEYNGSTWSRIGGDGVNSSWPDGTNERVRSLAIYNGELYAGLGDTAGDSEVWRYDGTSWVRVGGNSINSGWTNAVEYVSTLIDYKGKLYAGTGWTANADAAVWSLGNNAFLSSNQDSQDTGWHHIAAAYNGTSMKLFIDGVEDSSKNATTTPPNNSLPLKIGSTYGSGGRGEAQGYFEGKIDEIRLSSAARTNLTSKPYPTSKQTIELSEATFQGGVESFESFSANESLDGGSIEYRLSSDDGETWRYWDGNSWEEANTLNDASSATEISDNINEFEPTFAGIKWQAVLSSNGSQRVSLNSVTIEANSDTVEPSANASNIEAFKAESGSQISPNGWTNGSSPYFSWDEATDAGSGILGYCLYLGQDGTANPETTKGLLGNSPLNTNDTCQFAVSASSINLATAGLLATPLTTSSSSYKLRIKAIDKAGNVSPSSEEFEFRFDNTPPTNPGFVSSPSGFINTKEAVFTWPTSGGQAPSDGASGVAGLQYRINNTAWYGDNHSGTGDSSDLLSNDGSYTTVTTPDYDNIEEGTNTVFFRTWDNAGNVTTNFTTAALKINTTGAPSEPENLTANPSTNTTNSFSFSWDKPNTFIGDENNLNYCYTINTLPSPSSCIFTGNGIKSIQAGPYATQPGGNVLYVAARDESNNINYQNYSFVTFTANTPSPGIPTNTDIVDASIKLTENWRLAITWDAPNFGGAGISSYKVYRSTNNTDFNLVGSSASTTYIDSGLSQRVYYYRIKACDSTNNCGANGTTVSLTPTGKFTEPANLTRQPESSNITTKKARIDWTTDRQSDSKIAIGTKSGKYGAAEIGNSDQVTAHTIDIDNLAAGTTYYYVVKWTDQDGNTGTSQEFSFTTKPAPVLKEVSTAKVGLSNATIGFTSIGANKVNVYFGESESFGGLETVNTSSEESSYSVTLEGLKDGTKYYYQLSSFDSEGTEYKGNIFSFSTPSRPRIASLQFEPIKGEPTSTQRVTWATNVPGTSTVNYGKVGTGGTDIAKSGLTTSHEIIIRGLEDDSRYFLVAQSRDKDGNLATSDQQSFRTSLDTRPPKVKDVSVEPSIRGTGAEARGQVIVSWKTDEPSTSQVGYAEGSSALVFNNKSAEDTQLTTEHIVVVSDLPTSRVYSLQPISFDKARNPGVGEPETAIIGRATESVLTIILNTLQRVFGL